VITSLQCRTERWLLKRPLVTSATSGESVNVIVVELRQDGALGRGEAAGVWFHDETPASMTKQIEGARSAIEGGIDRIALQKLLPPGGARNAIDCALWELEAKLAGTTVAALADIVPTTLQTATTISLAEPVEMAAEAMMLPEFDLLKLKLGANEPVDCVAAVRRARSDARLLVDANRAWTPAQLMEIAPALADLGVELIEQPCHPEVDGELRRDRITLPICADESCLTRADLPRLTDAYSAICIKLDKSGGLTEALALASDARALGMDLMIGNMLGTSLAMAPLSVIGPWCRYCDLDGPLLLRHDRDPGMAVSGSRIAPLIPDVWG